MLMDRTCYLSEPKNIKYITMIKNVIEREILDVENSRKKTYTSKQVIKLYEALYKKLAYNIEFNEHF
jgi:hypothetical protein